MDSVLASDEQLPTRILLVVGVVNDINDVKYVIASLTTGISKWCATSDCNTFVDEFLQNFAVKCTKTVDSDSLAPCITMFCSNKEIEVILLTNPTCFIVTQEIKRLIISPSKSRLVVYGGHGIDSRPDWYLQDGLLSMQDLLNLLQEPKVSTVLKKAETKPRFTISCVKAELWKRKSSDQDLPAEMDIIDPFKNTGADQDLSNGEAPIVGKGLQTFEKYLEDVISEEVRDVFVQLEPPEREGFLKIRNPALYIFPGGNGDSTFFTVNGCNILINGGALTSPWFWRLLRHQDRVDCIIATHLGSDCLRGINSFFLRKVHEKQLRLPVDNTSDEYQQVSRCLISPDLGQFFMNVPQRFSDISLKKLSPGDTLNDVEANENDVSSAAQQLTLKTMELVEDTMRLSKALGLNPLPLTRKQTSEPFTVFSKIGIGQLDLYIINPEESSKELTFIREKWGCSGENINAKEKTGITMASGEEGTSLLSDLASICCLAVWYPASKTDRIVRLLFPGNTSQVKILEGLSKIKNSDFMSMPVPTASLLNKAKSKASTSPSKAARSSPSAGAFKSASQGKSAASSSSKTQTKATTATTAASKPKASSATVLKKSALAAKKQTTKEASTTATRSKREANGLAKPADKRVKAEKATRPATTGATATTTAANKSRAATAKPRPGPVHAKAEARVHSKTKTAVSKTASKTSVSDPKSSAKAAPKSPPKAAPKSPLKSAPKSPAKVAGSKAAASVQSKKSSATHASKGKATAGKEKTVKQPKKPEAKQATAPDTAPRTPPEDLTEAFSQLKDENSSTNDAGSKELSKRPSPEGQDMHENQQFVEVQVSHVTVDQDLSKAGETPDVADDKPSKPVEVETSVKLAMQTPNGDVHEEKEAETVNAQAELNEDLEVKAEEPEEEKQLNDDPIRDVQCPEIIVQRASVSVDPEATSEEHDDCTVQADDVKMTHVIDRTYDVSRSAVFDESQENVDQSTVQGSSDQPLTDAIAVCDDQVDVEQIEEDEVDDLHTDEQKDELSLEEKIAEQMRHESAQVVAKKEEEEERTVLPDEPVAVDVGDSADLLREDNLPADDYMVLPTERSSHSTEEDLQDYGDAAACVAKETRTGEAYDAVQFDDDHAAGAIEMAAEDVVAFDDAKLQPDSSVTPSDSYAFGNLQQGADNIHEEADPSAVYSAFAESGLESTDDKQESMSEESDTEAARHEKSSWAEHDALMSSPPGDYLSVKSNVMNQETAASDSARQEGVDEEPLKAKDLLDDGAISDKNHGDDVKKDLDVQIVTFDESIPAVIPTPQDEVLPDLNSCADDVRDHSENGWHPTPFPSDPQSMLTDTSPSDMGSYEVHTPGEDSPEVLDNAEHCLSPARRELKLSDDNAMSDTPLSSGTSTPIEHAADTLSEQVVDVSYQADKVGQLLEVEHDPLAAEKSLEKDEVCSTDVGHSFSTTTTTSKKAILESPISAADLDSAYNIPSVGGSISAGMSSVVADCDEPRQPELASLLSSASDCQGYGLNEESEILKLHSSSSNLLDANGNERQTDYNADDWKNEMTGVMSLNQESTPIHAWPEAAEEQRESDGRTEIPDVLAPVGSDQEPTTDTAPADQFEHELGHLHADRNVTDVQRAVSHEYELHDNQERLPVLKITDSMLVQFDETHATEGDIKTTTETSSSAEAKSDVDVDATTAEDMDQLHSGKHYPADASDQGELAQPSTNPFAIEFTASQVPDGASAFDEDFIPIRQEDPMMAPDNARGGRTTKKAASGAKKSDDNQKPYYFDLAYIPHHANKNYVNVEFFKRIRSRYYVISGVDASSDEPSRDVLQYLLEGKKKWTKHETAGQELENVTVIPTHNSQALHDWYQEYHRDLQAENIHLVASGSKVIMHDETVEACKVEF